MAQTITVHTTIHSPVEKVWQLYTEPEHVKKWNNASSDWHTSRAHNDLRVGGKFVYRMEAKDGSQGFDFGGVYTHVEKNRVIAYSMDDGRKVTIRFNEQNGSTNVHVTFEAESENPIEMQRGGWQAILDNFKRYVEINQKRELM